MLRDHFDKATGIAKELGEDKSEQRLGVHRCLLHLQDNPELPHRLDDHLGILSYDERVDLVQRLEQELDEGSHG